VKVIFLHLLDIIFLKDSRIA